VPAGFAHGFCVLSERAQVEYKCTDYYHPEDELRVLWSDPELGIQWPVEAPNVSEKDRTGLPLRAFGPPIPLALQQGATDGAGVAAAVQAALADSPGVVGVPWSQLRLSRAAWIEAEQAWVLRFDQVVPGLADPPGPSAGALRPQVVDFGPALSHGQPVVWSGALHVIVRDNAIVSLQAPSFAKIQEWRCEQEEGLLNRDLSDADRARVARFIQHFERITRHMMSGGRRADIEVQLDARRNVTEIKRS
jgi:hypothetical protein